MLYNNKFLYHKGLGISKAKDKFLMMCSFPEVIQEIYKYSNLVATCGWLADRYGYITSEGILRDYVPALFKQYKCEDAFPDVVKLDQKIFELTTNWVIYPGLESMVEELEWDKEGV